MSTFKIRLYRSKQPGACKVCGQPSYLRIGLKPWWKPIHPECYDLYPINQDPAIAAEAEANAIYTLAEILGATLVKDVPREPGPHKAAPIRIVQGACAWCGQPGIGITSDTYIHCRAHLWPPFTWPPREESKRAPPLPRAELSEQGARRSARLQRALVSAEHHDPSPRAQRLVA